MKTFIIAGCGRNHLGNMETAKDLIRSAADAGCDAARFQTYITERFVDEDNPDYDLMKRCELTYEEQTELKAHADSCGIEFLTTVFDTEGVFFALERLGLRRIKVGAPLNSSLFMTVNTYGNAIPSLHVMFSSGTSTWAQVDNVVNKVLFDIKHKTAMHFVAGNPTDESDVKLDSISTLKWALGSRGAGYTDFTGDILAPSLAVIAGASLIEKNLTISPDVPDAKTSVSPNEMEQMVGVIRMHEQMMGDGKIGS